MSCEKYRDALTEIAAANMAPTGEVLAHLGACASCREQFNEERQLFAAVDSGLRVAANAEVPASLLHRVRAGLNGLPVPRRSWFPISAAFAAAAFLLIVTVFVRGHRRTGLKANPELASAAHEPSATRPSLAADSRTEVPGIQAQRKGESHRSSAASGKRAEVSVLIPAGQRAAVDRLIAGIQSGAIKADFLADDKAEPSSQDLQLSPVAISPMEIKPLPNVSEESTPGTGNSEY
jgi:hypothetical protein